MPRTQTKIQIIQAGAALLHRKGFNYTGIQDIVTAAGVPKGSFYFYFRSKEDFGLAVIEYFEAFMLKRMDRCLVEADRNPLDSLRVFFDDITAFFEEHGCENGCPVGNISQETANVSDRLRERAGEAMNRMKERFRGCVEKAQEQGRLDGSIDADRMAGFILDGWEGAMLRMKTERSLGPLQGFTAILFGYTLRGPTCPEREP